MIVKDIIHELRKTLKANNVDDSNYTDYQLENRFNDALRDLEGSVGFSVEPSTFDDIKFDFRGKSYLCSNYPVLSVNSLVVDDKVIEPSEYKINKRTGVIRFKQRLVGDLEIEYSFGLSDYVIKNEVFPLVYDIISQSLINGVNNNIKSIKEGDFSITYTDNLQGLSRSVDERINRLKSKYLTRVSVI